MSLWGFDGEDNSLTSWSSLSQFDDMIWNEFGETNGDHVVPNPNSPQSSWLHNGDRRKRMHSESGLSGCTIKGEPATSTTGVADSASELSSDVEYRSRGSLLAGNPTNMQATFSVCEWTGLGREVLDLTAESEPFGSDHPPASQETDDAGDDFVKDHQSTSTMKGDIHLYACKDESGMASNAFSMPDVGSQDCGLEMFGSENIVSKADALLELGWENISSLDDMDKLFRNNDASFESVLVNGSAGLDWPSSSAPPRCVQDRAMEFEKPSRVSEPIAPKVEDKTEVVFGACVPRLAMDNLGDVVADNGSPGSLSVSAGEPVRQSSHPCEDKRVTSSEAKAYRVRRHPASKKRSDDRFKRTTAYRKLSPGPSYTVHNADERQPQILPLRLPGQPPLLQPATSFPLPYFPSTAAPGLISAPHQLQMTQGVPYIQVAYPVQPVPAISSCPPLPMMQMQHPQSMFVDIHQTISQGQRQPHLLPQASPLVSGWSYDVSNRPPTSSVSMTPQEKMEKLRWRQQIQARMAVEQQQLQLLKSHNPEGIDPAYQKQQVLVCHNIVPSQPRRTLKGTSDIVVNPLLDLMEANHRLVVKEGDVPSTNEKVDADCSLESSVLCQLKSTVSALDIGTRLCIRDALYRLARSAMKRRAAGGDSVNGSRGFSEQDSESNAVESSTASGPASSAHSKATSMSVVETETNPIDRSIAKLLFSKPPPPMFGRPYAYA